MFVDSSLLVHGEESNEILYSSEVWGNNALQHHQFYEEKMHGCNQAEVRSKKTDSSIS